MDDAIEIRLSKGCTTLQNPPLGMSQGSWEELCKVGEIKMIAANTRLCLEGEVVDSIYIVLDGYVLIQQGGKTLDIVEPGESLGAGLVQTDTHKMIYPLTAITLKSCEVLKITPKALIEVLQKMPELNFYFFKQIQTRMLFLQNLNVINKLPVHLRLAHFLIKKEHLLSFSFMTKKLMADILNTSPESVIRTTTEFVNQGILKRKKQKIILTEKIHPFILCQKTAQI